MTKAEARLKLLRLIGISTGQIKGQVPTVSAAWARYVSSEGNRWSQSNRENVTSVMKRALEACGGRLRSIRSTGSGFRIGSPH